jgi:hypothetical protein
MRGRKHSAESKEKISKAGMAQSWVRRRALTEVKEINEILISKREEG